MSIIVDPIDSALNASDEITVLDLISYAYRLIGVKAAGSALSAGDALDGFTALKVMLRNWSVRNLLRPALTKEYFPLVAEQSAYSIGPYANFDTVRPFSINRIYLKDSAGNVYNLSPFTQDDYNAQSDRDINFGIPYRFLYDPQPIMGILYLYPAPIEGYTMYMESLKPFAIPETSTNALAVEPDMHEALIYNLAVRLAPMFGMAISAEVAKVAQESLQNIIRINSRPIVVKDLGYGGRRYNGMIGR